MSAIMACVTEAPTPMMCGLQPPGAPTVVSPGPLLPALLTKMTPFCSATWRAISMKRP